MWRPHVFVVIIVIHFISFGFKWKFSTGYSLLLLSFIMWTLVWKSHFCKYLNIIYYFCKIILCWYRLRSSSCETSSVFRSACGLETDYQVMFNYTNTSDVFKWWPLHLISRFNLTVLSHSGIPAGFVDFRSEWWFLPIKRGALQLVPYAAMHACCMCRPCNL